MNALPDPLDGIQSDFYAALLHASSLVETRIVPFITTGVLHETSPTVGQIGTGVARVPITVFEQALVALARKWELPLELPEFNAIQLITRND